MNKEQVVDLLRAAVEKAGPGGQSAWAREHGVATAYVSDVLKGRRDPGAKLLDALGIERIVTYRRRAGR